MGRGSWERSTGPLLFLGAVGASKQLLDLDFVQPARLPSAPSLKAGTATAPQAGPSAAGRSGVAAAAAGGMAASFAIARRQKRARASLPAARATDVAEKAAVEKLTGPTMKVAVFGATGYIGRAVAEELAARGHEVLAVTRAASGISGKEDKSMVSKSFSDADGVGVAVADVTKEESLKALMTEKAPEAAICCLASRSGGRKDSFDIDYQATVNCVKAARDAGVKHFVLLSAVCVQRPLLAFQEAKLLAEKELQDCCGAADSKMSFSIVQPTAFFKSLLGQVKGVKGGSPYVMFGDGTEVRCKPISEQDLASFIADCLWDPAKRNAVLPIGGPGKAMSFKEQGELIFKLLDKEPNFICVPYAVFDVVQGVLDFIAGLNPDSFSDIAEYGRIGRYYAEQSMLVLDKETGKYSAELTPSYGTTSLADFLEEAVQEGSTKMESQQLGDQSIASRVGME